MAVDHHSAVFGRGHDAPLRTDFRRPVYCLLGLPFDAVDRRQAVDRIGAAAILGSPCFLSTPNLNFLAASRNDTAFRDSVIHSDLSVADGMPIVWLARLLGIPLPERVAGSDIFDAFIRGAGRPLKVYFFGGQDGVAESACSRLNAMHGPVRCVGCVSPGNGAVEEMSRLDMIDRINRSGADFVAVALGARKGQAWIERNRAALNAPVVSHLGAVINFVAGTVRRAPAPLRRLGLEWLWRIKEEPGLWRRYAADAIALGHLTLTRVIPALFDHALDVARNTAVPATAAADMQTGTLRIKLAGSFLDGGLPVLRQFLETITRQPADIDIDLGQVARLDAGFVGSLMLLYGHQTRLGRALRVIAASAAVRRELRYCCAEFLLEGTGRPAGSGAA